jgi:hypothetical protein
MWSEIIHPLLEDFVMQRTVAKKVYAHAVGLLPNLEAA